MKRCSLKKQQWQHKAKGTEMHMKVNIKFHNATGETKQKAKKLLKAIIRMFNIASSTPHFKLNPI
ncbi:CLUMA_CG000651, isoform A [Clunio marinus]|uniref:CLUMA_CG000651, isoform A n=1 Tax=Clunio marinus TaxID=568069 RepID=A0A1J1HK24_9DIPT|nr:CLUMA_CG000651, isoform A [Clunio marinus]